MFQIGPKYLSIEIKYYWTMKRNQKYNKIRFGTKKNICAVKKITAHSKTKGEFGDNTSVMRKMYSSTLEPNGPCVFKCTRNRFGVARAASYVHDLTMYSTLHTISSLLACLPRTFRYTQTWDIQNEYPDLWATTKLKAENIQLSLAHSNNQMHVS